MIGKELNPFGEPARTAQRAESDSKVGLTLCRQHCREAQRNQARARGSCTQNPDGTIVHIGYNPFNVQRLGE
jgi:hypothetical protein